MEYLGPVDFSNIWHAAVFFCQSINEYLLNGQAMFSTYLLAMQEETAMQFSIKKGELVSSLREILII